MLFNGNPVLSACLQAVEGNSATELDYETSISRRSESSPPGSTPTPCRYGASTATPYVDSDLSFQAVNTFHQGSASGTYTVRGGETLTGIAQGVWGDANLWYKIAEAFSPFQLIAGSHPGRGGAVHSLPAVAPECGGPAV